MKTAVSFALALNFLCGCLLNSSANSKPGQAEKARVESLALKSQDLDNSSEILTQTLTMMRQDLEIFLQAGEYEAALMQIGHYRENINRLPDPSKEAIQFRDGELYYYQALCQSKSGEKEKAAPPPSFTLTIPAGLKLPPSLLVAVILYIVTGMSLKEACIS